MTSEEAIRELKIFSGTTKTRLSANFWKALEMAIKALEQESVLDKINAEIQKLRGCSCGCSDGIIDDVEDIINKYKAESEDKE